MDSKLDGLRVAILATDGFEQVELIEPRKALDAAGAFTAVVSPKDPQIQGWNHTEWGQKIAVDHALSDADPKDYDALLLPGGVMNPDALRMQPQAVAFVKVFLRCRQTRGGDLPRPLDDRGERGGRELPHDLLALAEDGHQECRGRVGRSGGGRGR